jgi:hypothetical protein
MDSVRDSNGDNITNDPGIVVLLRNPGSGAILVHARDLITGATIDKISFLQSNWTPVDVVVIDDVNGDGNTDDAAIGVLALDEVSGKILMQVRSLGTSAKIATLSFMNANYLPVAAAVTLRPGLSPLIGVLGEEKATGKILVQSRQLSDRSLQMNTKFLNFDWRGRDIVSIADGNSDGIADDAAWVVQGENTLSHVNIAKARLVSTGTRVQDISIISASWQVSRLTKVNDISGNSREELGAFARNRTSGKRIIQIRDYAAGSVTQNISP